jgi:DNA-binding response OmpR family regulator
MNSVQENDPRARTQPSRGEPDARILIVDDHADSRDVLRYLLELRGFDVFLAESSEMAVRILEHAAVDLVVLDVMMPGLDGFAVAKWMREWPATAMVPIVMLTARGDVETRARAASVGAGDYVVKPFEVDDLVRRLRAQLQPQGRAA